MTTLDINGIRIGYDVTGDGPPVLLLNSFAVVRQRWQLGWAPALLDAGHQVITMDTRGVGESGSPPAPWTVADLAADAAGLVEHLAVGPVRIVGYSMGGWMAEHLLATRPDLVRSAVLLSCARPATAYARLQYAELLAGAVAGRGLSPVAALGMILTPAQLQDDALVEATHDRLGVLRDWPAAGYLGQCTAVADAVADPTHRERWPSIAQPVLVVGYDQDVEFAPRAAAAMASALPGGELVTIGGAAHGGPFTHAEETIKPVLEFLSRHR